MERVHEALEPRLEVGGADGAQNREEARFRREEAHAAPDELERPARRVPRLGEQHGVAPVDVDAHLDSPDDAQHAHVAAGESEEVGAVVVADVGQRGPAAHRVTRRSESAGRAARLEAREHARVLRVLVEVRGEIRARRRGREDVEHERRVADQAELDGARVLLLDIDGARKARAQLERDVGLERALDGGAPFVRVGLVDDHGGDASAQEVARDGLARRHDEPTYRRGPRSPSANDGCVGPHGLSELRHDIAPRRDDDHRTPREHRARERGDHGALARPDRELDSDERLHARELERARDDWALEIVEFRDGQNGLSIDARGALGLGEHFRVRDDDDVHARYPGRRGRDAGPRAHDENRARLEREARRFVRAVGDAQQLHYCRAADARRGVPLELHEHEAALLDADDVDPAVSSRHTGVATVQEPPRFSWEHRPARAARSARV